MTSNIHTQVVSLDDADRALADIEALPPQFHEDRRAECLELLAALKSEAEQLLANEKVVSFTAARHRPEGNAQ